MNFFRLNAAAMLAGLVLDLIIGDPQGWPHPVIWMGKYISLAESRIRGRAARRAGEGKENASLRRQSVWLTASTVAIAMSCCAAALGLSAMLGKWPLFAAMSLLSWTCISARSLASEAKGVAKALRRGLEEGRERVARIVGRDTACLSEEEIISATVETVAENTTDGAVAPMMYLVLGGPVLAMGFKACSTLDSMVGYLDERYRDIGWSGARLDDALNFVPARICGLLMCLAAFASGLDGRSAFKIMKRDHAKHLSPNCAWSESAAAGALRIRLGGAHSYFGKLMEKPSIGDAERPVSRSDIARMNRLMYRTAALAAAVFSLAAWIAGMMM